MLGCGVHSGTLGPGVRLICLQSTDDRRAANFINSGSPLLYSPPPVLPLEHTCFASPPGLSSPWALTGGPASLSVNSFLPVSPHQGLQPRPASLRVRTTDPDTSTSQALKHHLSKKEPNTPPKVCPFSRCPAPENGTTIQPLTGAKHFSSDILTPRPAHIHSISGLGQFHLLSLSLSLYPCVFISTWVALTLVHDTIVSSLDCSAILPTFLAPASHAPNHCLQHSWSGPSYFHSPAMASRSPQGQPEGFSLVHSCLSLPLDLPFVPRSLNSMIFLVSGLHT